MEEGRKTTKLWASPCRTAFFFLLHNGFITWLRVKSGPRRPPGRENNGRKAAKGLDADCAAFAMSKGSHALADTGGSTRSITAADRESNRLRGRMHVWHGTYLSQE